jgi:aryl-alcohol dehydrogenase
VPKAQRERSRHFYPQLIELNVQGRFPFEKLTKLYSLDQINQAAEDSENGGTIKPIIRLSAA